MTFIGLKNIVLRKLKGDVDISTSTKEEWLSKLDEALGHITTLTVPTELETTHSFETFKVVRGCPIRKWELPDADVDEIDIDEELAYAATDYIAAKEARLDNNMIKFDVDFSQKITDYNWNYFSKGDDYEM